MKQIDFLIWDSKGIIVVVTVFCYYLYFNTIIINSILIITIIILIIIIITYRDIDQITTPIHNKQTITTTGVVLLVGGTNMNSDVKALSRPCEGLLLLLFVCLLCIGVVVFGIAILLQLFILLLLLPLLSLLINFCCGCYFY